MKRWPIIVPMAWRNVWRTPRRTGLTMLAIFVAVLSMVLLGAFMRAWARSALVETINNLTGHGQIHAPGYLDDPSVDHRIHQLPVALRQTLAQAPIIRMAQRVRVPAMLKTERSLPINKD